MGLGQGGAGRLRHLGTAKRLRSSLPRRNLPQPVSYALSLLHVTRGYLPNLITQELELTDQSRVKEFFLTEYPGYVILAAGKAGGIIANTKYPAEFIYNNIQIQNNVIHFAWEAKVKKLVFLASSCIYPKICPQPMREDYLLTGSLEPTSEPYAIAKIAGIKMCQSYNRQYHTNFISVVPDNLYGPNDDFDSGDISCIVGFAPLLSQRCTVDRLTPISRAKSSCVQPCFFRSAFIFSLRLFIIPYSLY